MTAALPEALAILAAAGLVAGALVVESPRRRWWMAALALVLATVMVIASAWNSEQLLDARERPELAALAIIGAGLVVAALALVGRRAPIVIPLAALATVALRVPVPIGPDNVHLLIPLYLVIAAGVAERLSALTLPAEAQAVPARYSRELDAEGALRALLAASVALYAIQTLYSANVSQALESTGFFLVPFAALFLLLREVRWSAVLAGRALAVIALMGVAFALIAFVQYGLREIQLNEQLIDSNQIHSYFRVNSVFFDPNVLARYLALAVVALATVVACARMPRIQLACFAAAAGLVAALAITFSISGLMALGAGLATVAVLRFGRRALVAGAALALLAAVAIALAGGLGQDGGEGDFDSATSGRASLASGGLELFFERPVHGFGAGGFGAAFSDRIDQARTTDSHTEPVTVAAEQGLLGLALYAALVLVSLVVVLRGTGPGFPARLAIAACYVALLVHTLAYAGYLSDALTWALLAIGAALAAGARGDPSVPVREA